MFWNKKKQKQCDHVFASPIKKTKDIPHPMYLAQKEYDSSDLDIISNKIIKYRVGIKQCIKCKKYYYVSTTLELFDGSTWTNLFTAQKKINNESYGDLIFLIDKEGYPYVGRCQTITGNLYLSIGLREYE